MRLGDFVVVAGMLAVGCVVLTNPPEVNPTPVDDAWTHDSTVVTVLRALAIGMEREIIACVVPDGDGYRVEMPEVTLSERTKAQAKLCSGDAVARWHNHPSRDRPCYLSVTDIQATAGLEQPWGAVSTKDGELCWWSREQAQDAVELKTWMLVPLDSQRLPAETETEGGG